MNLPAALVLIVLDTQNPNSKLLYLIVLVAVTIVQYSVCMPSIIMPWIKINTKRPHCTT